LSAWLACYLGIETAFRVGAHISRGAIGALHRDAVDVLAGETLHYVLALLVEALKAGRALGAHSLALVGIVAWQAFDHVLVWIRALVTGGTLLAVALTSDRKGTRPAHLD